MGLVLFDWQSTRTTKPIISHSLSIISLFDGYLTESSLSQLKVSQNTLFTSISLFDGYLTEKNIMGEIIKKTDITI